MNNIYISSFNNSSSHFELLQNSSIYIFLLIIIICGLIYFYKNSLKVGLKQNELRKKREQEDLELLINNVCETINSFISQYNNITTEAEIISSDKRKEILNAKDQNALSEYKVYFDEFKEKQDLVKNEIELVIFLLEEEQNFEKAFFKNKELKEQIENLEHIVEKIKYIEVHNQNFNRNFTSQFKQEETPTVGLDFFSGCKTKEEADKRYKNLSKAFHPDTGCGDENLFKKMTDEYNNLKL